MGERLEVLAWACTVGSQGLNQTSCELRASPRSPSNFELNSSMRETCYFRGMSVGFCTRGVKVWRAQAVGSSSSVSRRAPSLVAKKPLCLEHGARVPV